MPLSAFYITTENTEDRLDSADNLRDAIRIVRELAIEGQAGEPVCIEYNGKNIRQLVLMPDGKVKEEEIR